MVELDTKDLMELIGNDEESLKMVMQSFSESAAEIENEIRASVTQGNAPDIADSAHKLKSAALSIGAKELGELCQQLEDQSNSPDGTRLDLFKQIAEALHLVNAHIEATYS